MSVLNSADIFVFISDYSDFSDYSDCSDYSEYSDYSENSEIPEYPKVGIFPKNSTKLLKNSLSLQR